MRKIYMTGVGLFLAGQSLFAQYTENFDSYNAGDYLGVVSAPFTTWSGTQGGAEDVQIVNNDAFSTPNSIYFSSTSATGGPDDVVLPFGGSYSTGFFEFESRFKVESGKGAYFNFQADATIGAAWAMDCYMVNDGNMYITSGGTTFISTTYPTNTWFLLRIEIDLNSNNWEVFIDGVSQGSFANPVNRIASIDYFPVNSASVGGNDQSGFWVDDVMYDHTPYTLPSLNGAVTLITVDAGLATQTRDVEAQVRNLGTAAITSFDLTYSYNGANITESVTGANITSLNTYIYTFTQNITLVTGNNPITVTISNVNGTATADGDPADDAKTIYLDPVTPAANKRVVAEEGTGTWCGWCPRGAVFMDELSNKYGDYFIGIAVHNNDPMAVTDYDAGISSQIGGYPSGLIDRGPEVDPSGFEQPFLQRVVLAPTGTMEMDATFDASNNTLTVNVTTTFVSSASGSWKLACVLTEDDVTGTASGYNQANYYSGGGSGVMGGYELLANPVPASQMVYDHVARAIEPSFGGQAFFPATINANDVFTSSITFTVDPSWDINKMHIVSMLIGPSGDIDNAQEEEYTAVVGIDDIKNEFGLFMYPNPAADYTTISLELESPEEVTMSLIDINGRTIESRNYGTLNGKMNIPVITNKMSAGIYLVNITVGDKTLTKRLIIE